MKYRQDFQKALKTLDKGIYNEAGSKEGVPLNTYFETKFVEEKNLPHTIYRGKSNFEIWKMRQEMKKAGLPIPPTTFEKMLFSHDIIAYGPNSDRIEKMFSSSDTAVLFPEWIMQTVFAAALQKSLVQYFIAGTQIIKGLSFRKLYLQDIDSDANNISLARAIRAGKFKKLKVNVAKQEVELQKFGIDFDCDYETIYQTPFQIYATQLARIGMQIGADETSWMILTLRNGDGNSNGLESAQTKETVTSTEIVKRDIIKFACALPTPYQLNVGVAPTTQVEKYWDAMSDLTSPKEQKAEIGVPLPTVHRWDAANICTSDHILGVDSSIAITHVTNDSVTMKETDRIIDRQVVKTVISKRSTFNINIQDAIGALDINH